MTNYIVVELPAQMISLPVSLGDLSLRLDYALAQHNKMHLELEQNLVFVCVKKKGFDTKAGRIGQKLQIIQNVFGQYGMFLIVS